MVLVFINANISISLCSSTLKYMQWSFLSDLSVTAASSIGVSSMSAGSVSGMDPVKPLLLKKSVYADYPRSISISLPVVGNGPVGMRFAPELLRKRPDIPLIVYGEEPCLPYNRIKLSSWLAGDVRWNELLQPLKRLFGSRYEERNGYRVTSIDTDRRVVTDSQCRQTLYSKLILATSSGAYVPPIDGIDTEGVFTLRNMDDASQLFAHRVLSHHTVVIGGGLLGLESARAIQPMNTRVILIEHADRLTANSLILLLPNYLRNMSNNWVSILFSMTVYGLCMESHA